MTIFRLTLGSLFARKITVFMTILAIALSVMLFSGLRKSEQGPKPVLQILFQAPI